MFKNTQSLTRSVFNLSFNGEKLNISISLKKLIDLFESDTDNSYQDDEGGRRWPSMYTVVMGIQKHLIAWAKIVLTSNFDIKKEQGRFSSGKIRSLNFNSLFEARKSLMHIKGIANRQKLKVKKLD